MKKKESGLLALVIAGALSVCCTGREKAADPLSGAIRQTEFLLDKALTTGLLPRTTEPDGSICWIDCSEFDWTEGFFPGTLWYMYEATGDEKWKEAAGHFQSLYRHHKDWSYHDLGFIFNCSYGNGLRLTGEGEFLEVLKDAANTLSARFSPRVGAIKSWDEDKGWQAARGWTYPVIIDNMMNLELLFEVTRLTGDSTYHRIADAHARTTMENHFRPDYSSYHVVDYDPHTGEAVRKHTAQGFSHESSWARGQAWALYGYVMCYRYTANSEYLDMAGNIARFIMDNPAIPADRIPYWDYNDPRIPDSPRDVSAAAITASALIELEGYSPGYVDYARAILDSLATDNYTAKIGTNNFFILEHSVGSIPHDNEIDVPLNYADYYYIEALLRLKKSEKNKNAIL